MIPMCQLADVLVFLALRQLVRIIHKCRRQWNISERFSTRNGTQFGLVLRVGLIGVLLILTIPSVSSSIRVTW